MEIRDTLLISIFFHRAIGPLLALEAETPSIFARGEPAVTNATSRYTETEPVARGTTRTDACTINHGPQIGIDPRGLMESSYATSREWRKRERKKKRERENEKISKASHVRQISSFPRRPVKGLPSVLRRIVRGYTVVPFYKRKPTSYACTIGVVHVSSPLAFIRCFVIQIATFGHQSSKLSALVYYVYLWPYPSKYSVTESSWMMLLLTRWLISLEKLTTKREA